MRYLSRKLSNLNVTVITFHNVVIMLYHFQGFLMDGYPKDSTQAAAFVQMIGPPTTDIYLDVPTIVLNDRLKKRGNFDDSQESING